MIWKSNATYESKGTRGTFCHFFCKVLIILASLQFYACEKFFDPEQGLIVKQEDCFDDWEEYRSAEMGMYALQQNLVEQMIVLGELRGDLLKITENASSDLIDIYNFNISKENEYASPNHFYSLVGACNLLKTQLETDHPEVIDKNSLITTYDRLYGEVLCMRAWTYFNAVRIFRKVPYIWPSLSSVQEIEEYVNSPGEYIDTIQIHFDPGGYYNDTIRYDTIKLEKKFLDMDAVIDLFSYELENNVKAVGVIHNMDNGDLSWDASIWNMDAMHCLLGQMYLYLGNYSNAVSHFNNILYNYSSENSYVKYGLDSRFARSNWKNIFMGIDTYEHIFTLWFNKSYQQTHDLQFLFSDQVPNSYMLKPSPACIRNWECIWDGVAVQEDYDHPEKTELAFEGRGIPGDFYRGHGVSYAYFRGDQMLEEIEVREMLNEKIYGNYRKVETIMEGVDTVVYKYSLGKSSFDHDANIPIYRAAMIHLYYSEIYNRWEFDHQGVIRPEIPVSLQILNDGTYNGDSKQLGVRGRLGFGNGDDAVNIGNIIFKHDPYTNEVIGYYDFTDKGLSAKQIYIEDQIMDERARELAFEGERFYDLIRIAKRRGDNAYLADKVSAKFPADKAEQIRSLLMNEDNWYIPYFSQ